VPHATLGVLPNKAMHLPALRAAGDRHDVSRIGMTSFDVHNWDFVAYCDEQRRQLREYAADRVRLGQAHEGSLTERLESELVTGLQWLDRLDRRDSFWTGRNELSTVGKLRDICNARLHPPSPEPTFAWYDVALCVHGWAGRIPDRPLWRIADIRSIPIAWLLEASWLDRLMWGDTPLPMRKVAEGMGRLEEFTQELVRYTASGDAMVTSWAGDESTG